uniref:Uncharacterized protein n=1 Tax=Oryza sativa subsp. japonica TaxID=39947 RepID=Q6EPA3_ORYSJ|nr:hypothetical protein [Oryza sativa Japonica Group]BAD29517.1 hypothetical protein [Oryza sativa Japonica Group]
MGQWHSYAQSGREMGRDGDLPRGWRPAGEPARCSSAAASPVANALREHGSDHHHAAATAEVGPGGG